MPNSFFEVEHSTDILSYGTWIYTNSILINLHSLRLIGFFNKILTLTNVNKFSFASLNRIFAVPFDKVRCNSTIKTNEFVLYCLRFL